LKEEIAKFRGHSVQKEQIFLGVGSDEAIDILFRIFCNPKEDNVVITPPTYGMYKVCAKINDVQVKLSPLTPEFDVDVPTVQAQVDGKTKLIFLCSPGNPTSKLVPLDIIETLANLYPNVMIIVDEAYIDFNLEGTALQILQKYPNIIVLQTLSKAFGLAGIRLGMAFASPEIIQIMNNVKAPYNINKLTVNVAKEAFEKSLNHYKENLQNLVDQRAFLHQELAKLPYIQRIYPSHANFILFRIPRSHAIYKTMADRGIVCRYR
jgi:histidinol-phosphate aminotransferase